MRGTFFILAALALGVPQFAAWAAAPGPVQVQVVDTRGLPVRDAVVELDTPGGWKGAIRFPWRNAMAQRNIAFVPGTLIVPKGANVAFPNLDNVRHSIYSFSKPARFQIDLYGRDQSRTQAFPITGTVALGCNIHDQMRGYVRVVDTPFAAKTDQNGMVRLAGAPAGSYRLVVWHPRARLPGGEFSRTLAVSAVTAPQKIVLALR